MSIGTRRLDDQQRRQDTLCNVLNDKLETRLSKDIHEAHTKIRKLEAQLWNLRLKAAAIGGSVGVLTAVLTEVAVKFFGK